MCSVGEAAEGECDILIQKLEVYKSVSQFNVVEKEIGFLPLFANEVTGFSNQ